MLLDAEGDHLGTLLRKFIVFIMELILTTIII